jgi:DNA polymerase zeta
VDGSTLALSLELEKALKLKGNAASKRQHIHDCEIVRAKKFYGYHSTEEAFVKIYLYPVYLIFEQYHFLEQFII